MPVSPGILPGARMSETASTGSAKNTGSSLVGVANRTRNWNGDTTSTSRMPAQGHMPPFFRRSQLPLTAPAWLMVWRRESEVSVKVQYSPCSSAFQLDAIAG